MGMNRIMVIGVAAGVGKSTFARKLGEALDISVCHLDRLYWKPGWVEASLDEFAFTQKEVVKQDQWIIDGNYSNTFDIRTEKADTIIYLELPLYVCLYRVLKRYITNLGRTRSDIGEGCKEKIDWEFITFILTTYGPRKVKMAKRFKSLELEKTIITLKNKKDINAFLEKIDSGEALKSNLKGRIDHML